MADGPFYEGRMVSREKKKGEGRVCFRRPVTLVVVLMVAWAAVGMACRV